MVMWVVPSVGEDDHPAARDVLLCLVGVLHRDRRYQNLVERLKLAPLAVV